VARANPNRKVDEEEATGDYIAGRHHHSDDAAANASLFSYARPSLLITGTCS
jgi:hypothetical protein